MQNPGFVTLNNHRLRAQRWNREGGVITFTTVIRGEHLGQSIVDEVGRGSVTLVANEETITGNALVMDERKSGEGTTAVHRIEIRIEADSDQTATTTLTTDEKLDLILAELRAIRREIADNTRRQSPSKTPLSAPSGAQTLLDFEIEETG